MVDYPNSRKARKMYLCLMVGQQEIPKGIDGDEMTVGKGVDAEKRRDEVRNEKRRRKEQSKAGKGKRKGKGEESAKDWILKKKELYRTRGKEGSVICFFYLDVFYRSSLELT